VVSQVAFKAKTRIFSGWLFVIQMLKQFKSSRPVSDRSRQTDIEIEPDWSASRPAAPTPGVSPFSAGCVRREAMTRVTTIVYLNL
jgi:hypothetical protein